MDEEDFIPASDGQGTNVEAVTRIVLPLVGGSRSEDRLMFRLRL
jgi:hypothetical protein